MRNTPCSPQRHFFQGYFSSFNKELLDSQNQDGIDITENFRFRELRCYTLYFWWYFLNWTMKNKIFDSSFFTRCAKPRISGYKGIIWAPDQWSMPVYELRIPSRLQEELFFFQGIPFVSHYNHLLLTFFWDETLYLIVFIHSSAHDWLSWHHMSVFVLTPDTPGTVWLSMVISFPPIQKKRLIWEEIISFSPTCKPVITLYGTTEWSWALVEQNVFKIKWDTSQLLVQPFFLKRIVSCL